MRLSYANVASTLALALAITTGGAYAATQLPKNSVGAKQLQKNSVTAKKVKDKSLSAEDLGKGEAAKALSGAAMGGALTGTFPNPQVNIAALDGVMKGTRLSTRIGLAPGQSTAPMSVPGLGTVTASCTTSPGATGLLVSVANSTPALVRLNSEQRSENPPVDTFIATSVTAGGAFTWTFAPSPGVSVARYARGMFAASTPVIVEVDALTSTSDGCLGLVVATVG